MTGEQTSRTIWNSQNQIETHKIHFKSTIILGQHFVKTDEENFVPITTQNIYKREKYRKKVNKQRSPRCVC